MNVKHCKSENEFHYSPPWRACPDFCREDKGVGLLKKIFTFLVYNVSLVAQTNNFKQIRSIISCQIKQ